MSQYQKLLLIINPALRHTPAINHAAALAKASGASLHIAGLIGPLDLLSFLEQGDRETAREAYLQDHRDWVKRGGSRHLLFEMAVKAVRLLG